MKKYTFQITIEEGNDEFWDSIAITGKTGCDEVQECIVEAMENYFQDAEIKLIKFTDKDAL